MKREKKVYIYIVQGINIRYINRGYDMQNQTKQKGIVGAPVNSVLVIQKFVCRATAKRIREKGGILATQNGTSAVLATNTIDSF